MTDAAEKRAAIVAAVREWLGTPYHHCADIKGVGVDCGMLLCRVYVDLGIVAPFDPRPYTHDWMLHRAEETFLNALLARAVLVETPQPGDVAMWRFGRCYSHGAVVVKSEPLTVVHAVLKHRRVIEEVVARDPDLSDPKRAMIFASFFGGVL